MKYWGIAWLIVVILLGACSAEDGASSLPTRVQIDEAEEEAAPLDEAAPLGEATRPPSAGGAPTLPPTWTPTAPPPTPTREAEIAQAQSVPTTPTNTGTIIFIYNGDSIVTLDPDAPNPQTQLIVTFGVGSPISQLTLSPQGDLIAFVSLESGTPEVWVSDLTGVSLRRISCLQLNTIKHIAWHPDNAQLLITAAPSADAPANVYAMRLANSGRCPENQALLIERNSTTLTNAIYNGDGSRVYFTDYTLYAYDVTTGSVSDDLFDYNGVKPLYELQRAPQTNDIVSFLVPTIELQTASNTGGVAVMNLSLFDEPQTFFQQQARNITHTWRPDGERWLTLLNNTLFEYRRDDNDIDQLANDAVVDMAYSPDGAQVAYISNSAVPQIIITNVDDPEPQALTQITEGSIQQIVWSAR